MFNTSRANARAIRLVIVNIETALGYTYMVCVTVQTTYVCMQEVMMSISIFISNCQTHTPLAFQLFQDNPNRIIRTSQRPPHLLAYNML